MVGDKTKRKRPPQHRIDAGLDAWAAAYAERNDQGLNSKSAVTEQALREFRAREDAAEMRRQIFEAWVAKGRPWPPPPGLLEPQE